MNKMMFGMMAALIASTAVGAVKLPAIFSDGMVIQRHRPIPVWGWAQPGEAVVVTLTGEERRTAADATGKWQVEFPPREAGGPLELKINGAASELRLQDILVGEVWLAAGQSNMEFALAQSLGGEDAARQADNPALRFFHVPHRAAATALEDIGRMPTEPRAGYWLHCDRETASGFSGVAYFFAARLQRELGVPVGVIASVWSGTAIEPWISPEGYRMTPALAEVSAEVDAGLPGTPEHERLSAEWTAAKRRWQEAADQARQNGTPVPEAPAEPAALHPIDTTGHPGDPTELYNAMIHPLAPFPLAGVIWYQGESNVGNGMIYADKMAALHRGWRQNFGQPELPLYYVELAPNPYRGWGYPVHWLPELIEAQDAYRKREPRAHMAVINDVGDVTNIHPADKRPVGERLAGLALKYEYGRSGLECDSAECVRLEVDGSSLNVVFDSLLETADGKAPDWFEIAGAEGEFVPAEATLDGSTVRLHSPEVPAPRRMRFGWHETAVPNLRAHGLPVGVFRAEVVDPARPK